MSPMDREGGAVVNGELLINPMQMNLHGSRRKVEFAPDFLVVEPTARFCSLPEFSRNSDERSDGPDADPSSIAAALPLGRS